MQFRKLGASDISVSEISLGSWLTYSGGVGREQASACVEAAFDAGINFIDTANVYGRGAAESLLGEVLAAHERSSYVLATKLYFPMSQTDRGLSAEQVHKQIDASLARLRVDYVDLYQCHRYDEQTPLEETMGALSEVVQAGKARHIGFSEWPLEKIEASLAIPGATPQVVDTYLAQRRDAIAARLPLPPFPLGGGIAAAVNIWRIHAEVTTADGAAFVREAVVRQGSDRRRLLIVLEWREGDRRSPADAASPEGNEGTRGKST